MPAQPRRSPLVCLLVLAILSSAITSSVLLHPADSIFARTGGRSDYSALAWAARPSDTAGPIPASLVQQGSHVRFQHLTPDMGLSQSVVTSILQDEQGFMWFGTQDGLNRYDGNGFKIFKHDPDNPSTLSSNFIFSLARDSQGSIWIGTNGGGLDRYDPRTGQFAHFGNNPDDTNSLSGNSVTSVYIDREGLVWAGTYNSGLNVLDTRTAKFTRYQHRPDDPSSLSADGISSIVEDERGALWAASLTGGLNRLDRETGKVTRYEHDPNDSQSLASNNVQTLYLDREGTLWVGTMDAGLDKLDAQTGRFVHYPANPQDPTALAHPWVYSLFEDRSGKFWVGIYGGGVAVLDRQTGRFSRYKHNPDDVASLAIDSIFSIYEDRSDILWFGTFGAGVDRYDPHKDKFLLLQSSPGQTSGLSGNQVWAIYQDADRFLWIGTNGGGLDRLNLQTGEWRNYRASSSNPFSLSNDFVFNVYQDRAGSYWISTNGGLDRFDPLTERFELFKTPPTVMTVYEDRSGMFWVGSGDGLLLLDRATGQFKKFAHDPSDPASLSGNVVEAIAEDANGVLWIGTQDGGLNRLDRASMRFTRYVNDPANPTSISDNVILSIYPAKDGKLWLGTTGGLNEFDPQTGRAIAYRERDGLPNDVVYGMLEDGQGRYWLSTNRGLARFDPRTHEVKTYRKSDGLQDYEFNMGAFFKNKDGVMFFGGISGLNIFYPDEVRDNPFVPPIVITNLQIYNRPVSIGPNSPLRQPLEQTRELQLSHEDGFFEFQFAALHYSAPEENEYAYKLDGFDKDWNYVGNRHFATYTNVPPGDYAFRVKGANGDGVWNEQGAALKIVIPPPFWDTLWFRLLAAAAVLGSVAAALTYRFRSIERQRQLLEHQVAERTGELRETMLKLESAKQAAEAASRAKSLFLANMSHEFRTPLNSVLGFVQVLLRDDRLRSDQRQNLEIVHRSGEHLLGLINDVLEMSKIEAGRSVLNACNFDLHHLLAGLAEMFAVRAESKGISLVLQVEPEVPRYIRCDEGKLRQVLMNLLGNAVKFTSSGQVLLRVDLSARQSDGANSARICLQVVDTGSGIAAEEAARLFVPFVQTRSGQQSQEGTGLGLAISQQYVRLMGGEIRVSSLVGRGSTFEFELPVEVVGPGDLEQAPVTRRVIGLEPGQPEYRLLAVDDNELNRRLLTSILAPIGFQVREAKNGQDAIQIWQAWEPHLIWMDMRMPVMDGYEATRRIKATTRGQATVIIALTASALEQDRSVILSEGCDDYIRKPFREQELFDALAKHLGARYLYKEMAPEMPARLSGPVASSQAGAAEDGELVRRLAAVDHRRLEILERAAILGDLDLLVDLAGSIAQGDRVLSDRLIDLANKFEHERILALTRQALERTQHA